MSVGMRQYEFLLQAETPIAHHEACYGNAAVLMRKPVRQPDGSWAQVPHVTGDTMRHGLREAAAYATLDCAGLLRPETLTEAALRLLFAGGVVTGRGDAAKIKLDDYRAMCDLFPPLRLLGGCADNRMISGLTEVEDATLVCEEMAHRLPPWVAEYLATTGAPLDTCRAHVEEVQRVRMDPSLDTGKRSLLTSGDRTAVEGRLLASETAHEEEDDVARAASKSTMLPRRYERIAQGSLLFWRVSARVYTELDLATLHVILASFLARAVVGGKKGTGHGRLVPLTGHHIHAYRPAQATEAVDVAGLARQSGELYRAHVSERREALARWLAEVDA